MESKANSFVSRKVENGVGKYKGPLDFVLVQEFDNLELRTIASEAVEILTKRMKMSRRRRRKWSDHVKLHRLELKALRREPAEHVDMAALGRCINHHLYMGRWHEH